MVYARGGPAQTIRGVGTWSRRRLLQAGGQTLEDPAARREHHSILFQQCLVSPGSPGARAPGFCPVNIGRQREGYLKVRTWAPRHLGTSRASTYRPRQMNLRYSTVVPAPERLSSTLSAEPSLPFHSRALRLSRHHRYHPALFGDIHLPCICLTQHSCNFASPHIDSICLAIGAALCLPYIERTPAHYRHCIYFLFRMTV